MGVGDRNSAYLSALQNTLDAMEEKYIHLLTSRMKEKFPYMYSSDITEGIYTPTWAGYVNPRAMVKAQQKMALQNGCDIIRDIVCDVIPKVTYQEIRTDSGKVLKAKKVLLTPGAFINCRNLLPNGLKSPTKMLTTTVNLVRQRIFDIKGVGLIQIIFCVICVIFFFTLTRIAKITSRLIYFTYY